MDALTMLKQDHRAVEQLFSRFEKAGDGAIVAKRQIADRVVEALSKHAAMEEQIFYPIVRMTVSRSEDTVLESLEEHHIVKWVLAELDGMDPGAERFDAKMTVLIENVRHHVKEEEQELFPRVQAELDRQALEEIGAAMQEVRDAAPEHPHPRSPDTPPGNVAAASGARVLDRIGDTVSGVAHGGMTVVQDLIGRITGRRTQASAPTGSLTRRKADANVRAAASDLSDDALALARRARETASTAAEGASRTARTAVDSTKATTRTAASGAKRTARAARGAAGATKAATRSAAKRTTKKATATKRASKKATKHASGRRATSTTRPSSAKKSTRAAKKTSPRKATSRAS